MKWAYNETMTELEILRNIIGRHASNYHGPSALDGLTITATDSPTEPRPGVSEPCLAMVVQGRKRTVIGDGVFDYAAGEYLVISLAVPVIGKVTEASAPLPFIGFGVRLDAAEIASLLLDSTELSSTGTSTSGAVGIGKASAGEGLLDAARHLVALLDTPEDAAILAPLYRRELLWRLLRGPQGTLVRQIGLVDGSLADIARAVSWIRDHHRDPIRVGQLADLASMSASSFHRHFRAVTCMTPIQYQKAIRLQAARLALIASPRDIARVAHSVGYDSSSQFSREYRRQFGAPPGRDAARLRSAGSQPVTVP
jgi:AraC-like DNA-binding protein